MVGEGFGAYLGSLSSDGAEILRTIVENLSDRYYLPAPSGPQHLGPRAREGVRDGGSLANAPRIPPASHRGAGCPCARGGARRVRGRRQRRRQRIGVVVGKQRVRQRRQVLQ